VPGSFSHPFSNSSLWNIQIGSLNPTYTDASAIQNVQFRDAGLANSWLQTDLHVYYTPSTAPTATWSFDTLNTTAVGGTFSSNGTIQLQTPTNLQFTNGGDGWAVFTSPDGVHSWEAWVGSYDAATNTYHAAYLVENDVVNGTGWGKPDTGAGVGIRAAGASLLGGIVTQDELNGLSIQHALAIELDSHQLAAATGPTSAGQFMYPAVTADNGSVGSYTGTIPMGAHFALPSDLDLTAAGLTPEGLALAKAYQTYGGYVVDTAGHTTALAQVEGTPQQLTHLFADIDWIRDHLVMTIDHGSGASSAAPQTDLIAQSDTAESVAAQPDIVQTDTHQAAVHQPVVPADVAGGTSSAPADTGSDVAISQNASDQPPMADAVTPVDQPQFEPAGAAGQTILKGDSMGTKGWGQHHGGRGMDAALASFLEGIGGKADSNQNGIHEGRQSFSHAITGSIGDDLLKATPNSDLFPGNGSQDTFVFAANFGHKGVAASGRTTHDVIQFGKSVFDCFASDLSHASQFGPHVDISASSDTLWLKNTKLGAFDSSDFHFA
jgi:hypothetical protein